VLPAQLHGKSRIGRLRSDDCTLRALEDEYSSTMQGLNDM
jgi:hypothetical protein